MNFMLFLPWKESCHMPNLNPSELAKLCNELYPTCPSTFIKLNIKIQEGCTIAMQTEMYSFSPSFFFFSPLKMEMWEPSENRWNLQKWKQSVFHISSLWKIADVAFLQMEEMEQPKVCPFI